MYEMLRNDFKLLSNYIPSIYIKQNCLYVCSYVCMYVCMYVCPLKTQEPLNAQQIERYHSNQNLFGSVLS
eukprot:UN28408